MKLRNFMYATMIACAFASCSKDDVIDNGTDPVAAEGELVITLATNDAKTKADEHQSADELTINNLTVYVYEVSEQAGVKTYTYAGQTAETDVIATNAAGDATILTIRGLEVNKKYICFGYANMVAPATIPEFSDAMIVEIGANGFVPDNLPMTGKSEEVTLSSTSNTALIKLDRAVSRVDVVGLTLDVDATGATFAADSASFLLTGLSINGVTTKVNTDGTYAATPTYWGGLAQNIWGNVVGGKTFFNKTAFTPAPVTAEDKEGNDTPATIYTCSNEAPAASFYILPNPAASSTAGLSLTTLVLSGKFSYKKGTTAVAPAATEYPVVIAKDGLGDDATGAIEQNKLYRISMTVAGPGRGIDGAGTDLIIKASVTDYTVLTQSVVVE